VATFRLTHDGARQGDYPSRDAALIALHRLQPNSWHHALTYEGWAIDEVPEPWTEEARWARVAEAFAAHPHPEHGDLL
jgi:hypothetical protein